MSSSLSTLARDVSRQFDGAAGVWDATAIMPALPIAPELEQVFPSGRLQPGVTISLRPGPGATSLMLALVAPLVQSGRWAMMLGMPQINTAGLVDAGIDVRRVGLIPSLGSSWADAVAVSLEAADVVVVCMNAHGSPGQARKLMARARQRGSVLIVMPGKCAWPERTDVELGVRNREWDGLGRGHGRLRRHWIDVAGTGRRQHQRERFPVRLQVA